MNKDMPGLMLYYAVLAPLANTCEYDRIRPRRLKEPSVNIGEPGGQGRLGWQGLGNHQGTWRPGALGSFATMGVLKH